MRQVKITKTAAEELQQIGEYIAQNNPEAARKLLKEFGHRFNLLRDQPLLGRARNDLLVNLRSFVFKDYVIFYLPGADGIEVYHVLHSAQNIEGIFKRFFDSLQSGNEP